MSRNKTGKLIVRLFVFVALLILVGADLAVSAQNANSSTTTQEDASAQNDNMSGTNTNRGGRRRRRGRRTIVAGDTPTEVQLGPGDEVVTDRPVMIQTGRCDPMAQEQTDLSGTYTGRVGYTDIVMAGDATLTISGNNFTLTNGQMTAEGRIVAVTTCNYTAVTMRFGKDVTGAVMNPPPPLPTVSLRARRMGGGLDLDTVPGESRMFSFHTTGASGSGSGMSGGMPRVRGGRRGGKKNGSPPPVGIKPPTAM
ncbi:MAG TPA: hypothetical protein VJ715_16160 [Pyrinomonadaceae bacterium]|nr:hypothetical protein [Pyrinomonadaceae bacterium]